MSPVSLSTSSLAPSCDLVHSSVATVVLLKAMLGSVYLYRIDSGRIIINFRLVVQRLKYSSNKIYNAGQEA